MFTKFFRWGKANAGLSSLGVQEVPWHPQILADQLILSQPEGADYAHQITTGNPGFPNLPTALQVTNWTQHFLIKDFL